MPLDGGPARGLPEVTSKMHVAHEVAFHTANFNGYPEKNDLHDETRLVVMVPGPGSYQNTAKIWTREKRRRSGEPLTPNFSKKHFC